MSFQLNVSDNYTHNDGWGVCVLEEVVVVGGVCVCVCACVWWVKERLLYLAGCRGSGLATHAGGVDRLWWDQIQIFIVRDFVQTVAIFQQLDVEILVNLLQGSPKEHQKQQRKRTT